MKRYLLLSIIFACLSAETQGADPSRLFQVVRHNINQVEICVSNFGTFGQDETGNNSGCWWPIGTSDTYIYGAGLWFGTIDSMTGDTLVSIGYFPYTGASEFAPGLSGMAPNHADAIIYIYPSPWPPNPFTFPMAPQLTLSHQDSWCCYNDSDIVYHVPDDTRPIGIDVYQTVYVWNQPAIEDVVWFFIDVKNVGGTRLNDCLISVTTDCDIGINAANDLCTGIVARAYVIGGDTVVIDNIGYQWQTGATPSGAIVFDLLQTPFDLVPGEDKDNDGILDQFERDSVYYVNNLPPSMWDVDNDGVPDWRDASENPQIGMTAFKQFTIPTEPQLDPLRYMMLAGYNWQTGIYEPYDTLIPTAADQRFLMSSGPFDLAPDSMVTIAFAVFFADWYSTFTAPDTALAPVDGIVQLYYDMSWYLYTGIQEDREFQISDCELRVSSSPIRGQGTISFSLPAAMPVSMRLYNTAGQVVRDFKDQQLDAGRYSVNINMDNLSSGTYFLVLDTPAGRRSQSFVVVR
jgi:hypothetical protein